MNVDDTSFYVVSSRKGGELCRAGNFDACDGSSVAQSQMQSLSILTQYPK